MSNGSLPEARSATARLLARVSAFWATRSLLIGAGCTLVDVGVLFFAVHRLHASSAVGVASGVLVGSVLSFWGNRRFAFHDHSPGVMTQFLKFEASTVVAVLIEAPLAGFLTDRLGVPLLVSKLSTDVAVFSIGQLLVLRYVIFPKPRPSPTPEVLSRDV